MTTETERRVPEHPGWRAHWVRYAEYEGQHVTLIDESRRDGYTAHLQPRRYWVSIGPRPCLHPFCDSPNDLHGHPIIDTDSLADAEAAFELACERLREGG